MSDANPNCGAYDPSKEPPVHERDFAGKGDDEPMTNEPIGVSDDESEMGLARSPKDPTSGKIEDDDGSLDRPGTESGEEDKRD